MELFDRFARSHFMQRGALVSIVIALAAALCICPVIAKAAPRATAIKRPAKVRRLMRDDARGESPQVELAARPYLDEPASFCIVVTERARQFGKTSGFISLFERTSGSLRRNDPKGFGSSAREFCSGVCPLRC
jgi:hypothetical protein